MNEEQIKRLLHWFIASSETRQKYGPKRQEARNENNKWIRPEVIQTMPAPELAKKVRAYFAPSGNQRAQLMRGVSVVDDIKKLRKALLRLLDESLDISQRINDVLDGQYKVKGFGHLRVTSFLTDFMPNKYCLWSQVETPKYFETIGWPKPSSHSAGSYYTEVLGMERKLAALESNLALNLDDIDLFLYTISNVPEGRVKVEEIKRRSGRPSPVKPIGTTKGDVRKPPTFSYEVRTPEQLTKARRREAKLLKDYERWLSKQGRCLSVLKYGRIECDAWEEERQNLIEAKGSTRREDIRMAVGQLFDYAFQGKEEFKQPDMAILLPKEPAPGSVEWLEPLGIRVIWRSGRSFVDNANGQFA